MDHFFPIFLRSNNIKVAIIGGGTVGTIRAKEMAKAGFLVKIISEKFSSELIKERENNNNLSLVSMKVTLDNLPDAIKESLIVISATNDHDLNRDICNTSRSLGKLCNNPSDRESSDFIVPISSVNENFGIAITTFGNSSLVSKELLKKVIEIAESNEMTNLLKSMTDVKSFLKENVKDPKVRYNLYHVIFNDKVFRELTKAGNIGGSLERAKELIGETHAQREENRGSVK